jgi:hypothetical protein
MRVSPFSLAAGCVLFLHVSTQAGHIVKDTVTGGLKISLHVVEAEPFFTRQEVEAKKVTAGMLIVSGAAPLTPEDSAKPNHHLVVHAYDAKSGKALTKAQVTMSFQSVDATGKPAAAEVAVPVVTMQAIGKGPQSTHFGNNVVMPDGIYEVKVRVNAVSLKFIIDTDKADAPATDHMHMK